MDVLRVDTPRVGTGRDKSLPPGWVPGESVGTLVGPCRVVFGTRRVPGDRGKIPTFVRVFSALRTGSSVGLHHCLGRGLWFLDKEGGCVCLLSL